jgi:hypothetical protein
MMDKDPAPHVKFHESGQARAIRILGLVGGQSRGFVDRDHRLVFMENAESLPRFRFREPLQTPDEHRRTPPENESRVSFDATSDRDPARDDGFPGEPPRHRALKDPPQLRGEPPVEGNRRVLADHDRDRLH